MGKTSLLPALLEMFSVKCNREIIIYHLFSSSCQYCAKETLERMIIIQSPLAKWRLKILLGRTILFRYFNEEGYLRYFADATIITIAIQTTNITLKFVWIRICLPRYRGKSVGSRGRLS
jgi:predicted DNA-binding transcriptional regulator